MYYNKSVKEMILMAKKLTSEQIIERCEKVGVTYVSHYYDNEKQTIRVEAVCECGERLLIAIRDLTTYAKKNKKYSCKKCGYKRLGDSQKISEVEIKKRCELVGLVYVSHDYNKKRNGATMVNAKCQCGQELYVELGNIMKYVNGNKKYLCQKCKSQGELNPNYKGGITPISNYLRSLNSQWFEQCKKDVEYTCQITGKTGVNLHTHHLKAFNTIVNEAHEFNNIQIKETVLQYTQQELELLEQYVAKWHRDGSNAVVLCEEIHSLFHNQYGYGNNTPEQFEQFKQKYLRGEFNIIG
jgi:hypothetical protein